MSDKDSLLPTLISEGRIAKGASSLRLLPRVTPKQKWTDHCNLHDKTPFAEEPALAQVLFILLPYPEWGA